jgi:hypothetical protein
MADNIVGGLFGVDPAQLQQQRMAQDLKEGFMLAQLSPMERATAGIYAGSKQLGRAGQSLLGMEDPQLQEAAMAKKISENFDVNSVSGLRGLAAELQKAGSLRYSQLAAQQANDLEKQGLGIQKTKMDITRTEGLISKEDAAAAQNEQLRAELSAAVQRGASRQEITRIAAKYGSADKILQVLSQEQNRADALAAKSAGEGDGVGKPGPVGKSGAYRDISGTVFGPTEMKPIRQEFEGAQKLLDTLNQVKASDVKDAESIIDWTTKGETKALASKKTLMAQTKIAASQLMEQIGQLPPGSASDADMRASMKSFPGYSDADALAAWVNETKRKLEFNINRGTDQFGFTARVKPTEPINLKPAKPSAGSVASDDNALINKYLTPKK